MLNNGEISKVDLFEPDKKITEIGYSLEKLSIYRNWIKYI